MGNIWGYWDCRYCGTKGIRGDKLKCPYCGIQIPPDTRYYIRDDIEEEVAEDELDYEAHWICEFCDTQNPSDAVYCTNCGSPREEAQRDYFGNGLNGYPSRSQRTAPAEERKSGIFANILKSRGKKLLLIPLLVLQVVIFVWLGKPVTRTAEVTGFEWYRAVGIEEFQNVDENGWVLPNGAKLIRTNEEVKTYKQVLDHYDTRTRRKSKKVFDGYDTDYRDLGNGQYEAVQTPRYRTEYYDETYKEPVYRNEPVYATKYYYNIDKWVEIRKVESSGKDQSPYWEKTGLPTSVNAPAYGDKREGGRTGEYYIIIKTEKSGEFRIKRDYDDWLKWKAGDKLTYKTSRFSDAPIGN